MEHFGIMDPGFFRKTLWFFMDPLMHYVRYQGKAILASKGTLFLKKKWKWYLVNFCQYSFSFWTQPRRIHLNQLANSCFDFLGYLSSVPKDTRMIKFDTIVPATLLIGSLSKAQFCTRSGHPISKPIWTELSDWDILDRFGQICKNLFHYHSGSSKKRTLYRLNERIWYLDIIRINGLVNPRN
ncbi:hypothetical protein BRADI_4g19713v3 [Brachypodium distachyon]|uniref:Maturase K n=1 Tax=Brachypodium distachyon TaxID=15368 RepID=A0A2K2CNS4_BRADI|nr:hypothetical protein BRADI_4g19713v3 [Brachypodium distachyon]